MLLRLLRIVHRSRRSLRDLCYTLIVLAGASAVLTYHISRRLPSRRDHHSEADTNGPDADENGDESNDPAMGRLPSALRHQSAAEWRAMPPYVAEETVGDVTASAAVTAEADEARVVLEGLEFDRKLQQRLSSLQKTVDDDDDDGEVTADDREDDEREEDEEGEIGTDQEETETTEGDEQEEGEEGDGTVGMVSVHGNTSIGRERVATSSGK